MSAWTRSSLTLALAVAALLSDWVWAELFMRRDTTFNICIALLVNAALLASAAFVLRRGTSPRLSVGVLRVAALLTTAALLIQSMRAALGSGIALPFIAKAFLMMLALLVVSCSVVCVSESINDRLMNAVMLASVAFIISPIALRSFIGKPYDWLLVAPLAQSRPAASAVPMGKRGVMFLLLDELGYPAAAPLAQDLGELGLRVSYQALAPAGANTLNVIPAMFDRRNFDQARPCGRSTICSGANALDFSRIRSGRPDVDATGLLLPYCDIRGLRSCYQLELRHEYGNAYVGLLAYYARRLGLRLPRGMLPPAEPDGRQGELVAKQVRFVDGAAFWRDGGILYAHLALPHPPGLAKITTLDRDYASNIEASRALLRGWVTRLRAEFGDNFSVIITSDHPLRSHWCSSGFYGTADCQTRSEFQTDRVPLIVASSFMSQYPDIQTNANVFDVLSSEARRLLN